MLITRSGENEIGKLSRQFPCVAVLGPRQVGKTTLVQKYVKRLHKRTIYLDMERHSDRKKLEDAELFFSQNREALVVIDEVQQMPELFAAMRPEIDAKRKPGRFILTGSASPELVKGVSESLAGRIAYLDIGPLSLAEVQKYGIQLQKHWFRGGFPQALLVKSNDAFPIWCENFIRSYVERDLSALFGAGINPSLARNFWNMVAIQNGNIWNAEAMSRSLGVTGPTVNRYLDYMEGAFLLRKLPSWYVNAKKRMVKSPKVYIRDSGLLHFLSNVARPLDLPGHPAVGASWEGYVIEEICKQLPYRIRPHFYRTHHGAETDLVLIDGVKPIAAIEIKYSLSPSVKEGFYNSIDDLGTKRNFVIYPGAEKYNIQKGIKVTSLQQFLAKDLKILISLKREISK